MLQSSTIFLRLCLVLLPWSLGLGCCPPKLQSYASPDDVLRSWQAQLCHDDVRNEYACLSADLKREMAGYETYVVARRALLEEQPFLAAALKYFDLPERAIEREVDPEQRVARLTFEHDGQKFAIDFVQETWVVIDMTDGPPLAAKLDQPLKLLVGQAGTRQWIELPKPLMSDEQRAEIRAMRLDERWKIDFISGLATTAMGSGP